MLTILLVHTEYHKHCQVQKWQNLERNGEPTHRFKLSGDYIISRIGMEVPATLWVILTILAGIN
jgi:hypothetical protein